MKCKFASAVEDPVLADDLGMLLTCDCHLKW